MAKEHLLYLYARGWGCVQAVRSLSVAGLVKCSVIGHLVEQEMSWNLMGEWRG